MSERYDAYRQLLDLPDPADLPRRGRRYTYPGDPMRRDRAKLQLERAYLRHRIAASGKEESAIVCVRRSQGARVIPIRRRA